jgi:adhesin transport system membrane fusion protein
VGFLAGFLYWAAITELDVVVRGQGKTISAGKNQLVQSPEAGVISSTYVDEGKIIDVGDVLFEIDLVELKGQLEQVTDRLSALNVKKARLQAESNLENQFKIAPEFAKHVEIIDSEKSLLTSRLNQLKSTQLVLETRLDQRKAEIQEVQIESRSIKNNLQLLLKEIETVEPLVKASLAPETRLITLEREREDLLGRLDRIPASISRINSAIMEIEQQLDSETKSFYTNALSELAQVNLEISDLASRLPNIKQRLSRSEISSPISGIVNRITYQSKDAYIKPGDVLIEIVPINDDLIVEAKIDPKDIAKVAAQDDVKISLTAYDAAKYGRIDGLVSNISADAIANNETGEQYYSIDVKITGELPVDNDEPIMILPGMVATVEVLSGRRTILEYFWQPLVKSKDIAFRE